MTSARRVARWCASRTKAVPAWAGCVHGGSAGRPHACDTRFGMPRPRCSIAVVAETRVGGGGWSVVGGGGSRVSTRNQQARCHRPLARAVTAERTFGPTLVIAVDARHSGVFSSRTPAVGGRRPYSFTNGVRRVTQIVQRGDAPTVLCAPARSRPDSLRAATPIASAASGTGARGIHSRVRRSSRAQRAGAKSGARGIHSRVRRSSRAQRAGA